MRTNFSEFFLFNLILFFIVFCAIGKNSMQKVKGERPFCRVIATIKFVLYSVRLFP